MRFSAPWLSFGTLGACPSMDTIYHYHIEVRLGPCTFLDKPRSHGRLEMSRYVVSATLVALMTFFIFAFSHKPTKQLNPQYQLQ